MTAVRERAHHLALFLPNLRAGGAERCLRTLACGFAEEGRRVDLVLARAEGPLLAGLPEGVRVVDLKSARVLRALPRLVAYLRRERPQALLSALEHANLAALLARRLAQVPTRVVVSVRTHVSRTKSDRAGRRTGAFIPRLVRVLYPWADGIVAVSEGVAADLAARFGLPPARLRVIYNPTVTPDLDRQAAAPVDHPWFLSASRRPVVLSVGRLTGAKDHFSLLRAFARLRRQVPACLVILGEGPERPALEALVRELRLEDEVDLPGFTPNPYPYMARASLYVLSSQREGLPNALIEALACGTPVVATDCESGPGEILEGGRWGPLVPVGDVEALAEAMAATLASPLPREVLASRGREFSLASSMPQYLALLDGEEAA